MKSLRNTFIVYKRELVAYFDSPVAYVILIIFALIVQCFAFFMARFLERDEASLAGPFFSYHPLFYMVLVPAVGMKLWSDERRLGTLELLTTLPVTTWQCVLGKYLAASTVWLIALISTCPIVITVYYLGSPDTGPIISGYLASYFYALSCLAVTSAVSAFTRSQVICFIVSVAICLMLTLMGVQEIITPIVKVLPDSMENLVQVVSYVWFTTHYNGMSKGLVVFQDVLYFLSVILIGLLVTHVVVQSRRS